MSATQPVTELTVRADGALAVLDRFEDKMEAAGAATDLTTGAVADFERRMETARKAIERGNAITTQSIERKSAEQRAWDRWSATVDRASALRIRLEKEAQQAAVSAANAVNLGYTTQEKALGTLIALEQRHAAQLRGVADVQQAATTATISAAAANDNLAMSTNRLAAANDNASFSTANVAAQFQDVAVTAAMGMSPIMIALQQGTQLSSILMTMKNPVAGLASAFMAMINPVSLLTIGLIALAASAIQFFTAGKAEAAEAANALQKHNDWLDGLLVGYQRVRDAAGSAADAAMRMPEGVVASDLQANLIEQAKAAERLEKQTISLQSNLRRLAEDFQTLADTSFGGDQEGGAEVYIAQIRSLHELGITANSTAQELDTAMVAARNLFNTTDDPAIKDLANEVFVLAQQLRIAQASALDTGAALRALPKEVQISLKMSQEFGSAFEGMEDLFIDPRSRFDVAREDLKNRADQATAMAQTYSELVGVGEKYATVLDSINNAEAAAAEKSASSAGKTDAEKMIGNYADLTRGALEYISTKEIEAEALTLTADVASRMRNEQELLNKAANDNIALSPVQREELASLAQSMAEADLVLAGAQMRMENRSPWETMASEIANLDAMVRAGAISWDDYHAAATRSMAGAAGDTLSSLSQITGALSAAFENNKALAVANAVINTAEGVTKALAQGGMFAFPIAAAIGVAGAAQIASIMSASPGGSGGAVRTPSASVPAMANAPQREAATKSPERVDVVFHGAGKTGVISGEDFEAFIRLMEERSADGKIFNFKVAR